MQFFVLVAVSSAACAAADRPLMWIDSCEGEPVEVAQAIKDLATARVIYLGERHTLERHHATQAKVIDELAQGGAAPSWGWSNWSPPSRQNRPLQSR